MRGNFFIDARALKVVQVMKVDLDRVRFMVSDRTSAW